jgi:glycosyltransferase involved in cell wall biosynthesis
MATYNGEKYIQDQLDSILGQLGPDDEIIISDDASTDRTVEIINSMNDKRIKLFYASFRNVIRNFENALKNASGTYIFLSDQDDIWYPNKVTELLPLLDEHDLIFSNVCVFTDNINHCSTLFNPEINHNGLLHNLIKNHCIGATMAFRSTVLKYAMPFPGKIAMHDMWIFFITSIFGRTHYYREPLVYYRKHEANVTNTGERTTNTIIRIVGIRLQMMFALFVRSYNYLLR